MTQFWTRTRRYMAALWLGTLALEAVVLWMAHRTNSSWFLLLALALLAVPIMATDATLRWLGRPPRKRWKRHDLEDALAAEAKAGEAPATVRPAVEP
jgi:hypothetical protein